MGIKITPRSRQDNLTVKTNTKTQVFQPASWWKAKSKNELVNQLLETVSFLKENQQYRYRQATLYSRMYSNYPLFGWAGTNMTKMEITSHLPSDRPTLNVVQSCIDTLVSMIIQNKPKPMFLTDNGDYKERKLSKDLNNFIQGEFYQTKAHDHGKFWLRDEFILGSSAVKVFKYNDKVKIERRLITELLADPNESMYGNPRQFYELQLMDRHYLAEMFPSHRNDILRVENAYPDNSGDTSKTISDLVMVAEGFHLASGPDAKDGRHTLACPGMKEPLFDEEWEKPYFPYVFGHYSKRVLGYWSQGIVEQIMGTQNEINKLLMNISRSIHLVGVPFVWIEEGSKVVKAHINNDIGRIGTYRGTKPSHEVAPCMPQEVYAQLQRLVDYAYQQVGLSMMTTSGVKPPGLNSGEAQRVYNQTQTMRFAQTEMEYSRFYEELAYLMFDTACDVAEETGSYQTIYPNKNGAKQIDLPEIKKEKRKQFIIQCFDVSALPKEPAGRLQKITEMIQAGMIDIKEGRRLLDFPDLDQVEKLANASEERIYQVLDQIVEDGIYSPPDPFMDLNLALTISVQYYNLYASAKLEESKANLLRRFNTQVQALLTESQQQPQPGIAPPQASPMPMPQSQLLPMNPQGAA